MTYEKEKAIGEKATEYERRARMAISIPPCFRLNVSALSYNIKFYVL